jgi:transposase InsO family protein
MPHLEIDWSGVQPGEWYVSDHTQVDAWVNHRGKLIRPWLTAVMDCRSRCIVGWHLGPLPHQDAIIAALRVACRDWAVPEHIHLDNGRDYKSRLISGFTSGERNRLRAALGKDWKQVTERVLVECGDPRWGGIADELGIEIHWAIAYAPWSKGLQERFFGTFHERCKALFPTYCGNSPSTRPECVEELKQGRLGVGKLTLVDGSIVPTLESARKDVAGIIAAYHARPHGGEGMDALPPLAVWRTARSLRKASEAELDLLMDCRGVHRVGPNGVKVKIGGATVGYGKNDAALTTLRGRDVLIFLSPEDVSHVAAFDPRTRKPLGKLNANRRIPMGANVDDVREIVAEQMRERSSMHKAKRASAKRTLTMTDRLRQRQVVREVLHTGTDEAPDIIPVRTGFEGVSITVRGNSEPPPPSKYDLMDLDGVCLFEGGSAKGERDD